MLYFSYKDHDDYCKPIITWITLLLIFNIGDFIARALIPASKEPHSHQLKLWLGIKIAILTLLTIIYYFVFRKFISRARSINEEIPLLASRIVVFLIILAAGVTHGAMSNIAQIQCQSKFERPSFRERATHYCVHFKNLGLFVGLGLGLVIFAIEKQWLILIMVLFLFRA